MKEAATRNPWIIASLLTILGSPLVIWASWDTINQASGTPMKIGMAAAILGTTYLGAVALFWWHNHTHQDK